MSKLQIQENYIEGSIAIQTDYWEFYFPIGDFLDRLVQSGIILYSGDCEEGQEKGYYVAGLPSSIIPNRKDIIKHLIDNHPYLFSYGIKCMLLKVIRENIEFEIEYKAPIQF